MKTSTRWLVAGAGAVLALGGAGGIASAASVEAGETEDQELTGATLTKAVAAATSEVPGEVVDTETGDDGAAYGVEVQRADGSVVEVQIDAEFTVTGLEEDDDSDEGAEGPDDD